MAGYERQTGRALTDYGEKGGMLLFFRAFRVYSSEVVHGDRDEDASPVGGRRSRDDALRDRYGVLASGWNVTPPVNVDT